MCQGACKHTTLSEVSFPECCFGFEVKNDLDGKMADLHFTLSFEQTLPYVNRLYSLVFCCCDKTPLPKQCIEEFVSRFQRVIVCDGRANVWP